MTEAKDFKAALQRDLNRLAEARDELRVQLKLAKAEAVEEWNKLEAKWQRVEEEVKRAVSHTKEPAREIGTGARHLLEELKHSYERVRDQLKSAG
jgi:predicted  nucleic acid-binding Zn-ribbon protein